MLHLFVLSMYVTGVLIVDPLFLGMCRKKNRLFPYSTFFMSQMSGLTVTYLVHKGLAKGCP